MASIRVLIVDDDVDSTELLSALLSARGFEVKTARTMEAALAVGQSEEIDLVLSDLRLPDGDGWALFEQLKSMRPVAGIAVSGSEGADVTSRCVAAGYGAQFVKPVDIDRLIETARRLVGDRTRSA